MICNTRRYVHGYPGAAEETNDEILQEGGGNVDLEERYACTVSAVGQTAM